MNWTQRKCEACTAATKAMTDAEIRAQLDGFPEWKYEDGALVRIFAFKNYYQTAAFVNAAVWVAHSEDHHPDIQFGYKQCTVRFHTHAVDGITDNDFICAAKVSALVK